VLGPLNIKVKEMRNLTVEITALAEKNPDVVTLWLYGSRARGDHHAGSDYDLAVIFRDWEPDRLERRLRPELLALDWLEALDVPEGRLSVVDLAIAPIPLGMSIISEGRLLLDSDSQRRMTQEGRIMSRWEIDYLHHMERFG
jgi:predicted nucleotidyltransferase